MLTEKEKAFISYWESRRIPYSSFGSKLMRGLPMASLFGLPILFFLLAIYLFFPEWYAKVSASPGSILAAVAGVFIAIFFFSFFRMHFMWELNEQAYRELKKKSHAA